jgi:hypothetical protein
MDSGEMFKKLMDKKKQEGSSSSPMELKAKGSVLADLMKMLDTDGSDKLKGLNKVTVASDSKSGLAHGLQKASDIVQKGPLHAEQDEGVEDNGDDHDYEDEDTEEHEEHPELAEQHDSFNEDESDDELHQKMAELQAKMAARKMRG